MVPANDDTLFDELLAEQRASSKSSILSSVRVIPSKTPGSQNIVTAGLLPSQIAYLSAKAEGISQKEEARKNEDASRKTLRDILRRPGNNVCCDCTESLSDIASAWAVLPQGVLVCVDCAATHRSLGTHISKVKGVHLDLWEESELAVLGDVGNAVASVAFSRLGVPPKIERSASQKAKIEAANAKYNGRARLDFVGAKEALGTFKEIARATSPKSVQDQMHRLTERVTTLEEHVGIATRGDADDVTDEKIDIGEISHESKPAPSKEKAASSSDNFFADFGL